MANDPEQRPLSVNRDSNGRVVEREANCFSHGRISREEVSIAEGWIGLRQGGTIAPDSMYVLYQVTAGLSMQAAGAAQKFRGRPDRLLPYLHGLWT